MKILFHDKPITEKSIQISSEIYTKQTKLTPNTIYTPENIENLNIPLVKKFKQLPKNHFILARDEN